MFRAYDSERDHLVAVKLFRLDLPPEQVHQLVSEFERLISAGLTHPSIAAPVATGIDGATAYLAEEYVAGESLDTTLRHGPASPAEALRVARHLAGALDAAAACHITHGVLHPRDVLLADDVVKLTGLGIARALDRVGAPTPVRRPYTAPERTVGLAWDRRADVFSLAAVIYELLWARRPSAVGDEAAASLTAIAGGDLERLRELFGRALAEDPGRRFDTAQEFASALDAAFAPQPRLRSAEVAGRTATAPVPRPSAIHAPAVDRPPVERPPVVDERRLLALDSLPAPTERQRAAETAPRLPLEAAGPGPDVVEERTSGPPRFTDVGSTPRLDAGAPPIVPPALIDAYRAAPDDSLSDTRSRSTVSPLAFALVIGAALGFAAGFGVGARSRSAPETATTLSDAGGDVGDGAADETADAAAAPSAVIGSLLVRSTPLGARVFVDGREYGPTPVTVGNLARGPHSVRVVRDGFVTDERQVTVTAAQRTHSVTVRLAPERPDPVADAAVRRAAPPPPGAPAPRAPAADDGTGLLTVESRPAGAQVFIDGRLVGTTPLVLPDVPAGEHALHLDRDGYRRWASPIRIVSSERTRVAASLDR